jgi:hypothetical protein
VDTLLAVSENLDLVRSIYANWEGGDFSTADWAHPQIEYVQNEGPEAGTTTGHRGMARSFRGFLGAWDEWHVGAEDYLELDRRRVLVPYHFTARGKTSGMEVGQAKGASLFHVTSGQVTRLVQHFDRDHALADLGMEE